MNRGRTQVFTLVELLMALTVLAMVTAAAAAMLGGLLEVHREGTSRADCWASMVRCPCL